MNFILINGEEYSVKNTGLTASIKQQSLRLEVSKPGQDKPYIVSFAKGLYLDSVIPGYACSCKGWIIKKGSVRKCKHVMAIAEAYDSVA